MKKLALIVVLAVVASRIFAEREDRPAHHPHPPRPVVQAFWDSDAPSAPQRVPAPPEPPPAIRTIPWHGQDRGRASEPDASRSRSKRPGKQGSPPAVPLAPAKREMPSWFPQSEQQEKELAQGDGSGFRVLVGRLSASEERARDDLRIIVRREIADWLAADVATDWVPPAPLVDHMIWGTHIQPVTWSLGANLGELGPTAPATKSATKLDPDTLYTLYRAGEKLDFSDARRAQFVKRYQRDVASARMKRSGSVIAVVLASLALFSLYIRTDEATKGYYTNRLRVLTLAGLGIAGTVAYHYWA